VAEPASPGATRFVLLYALAWAGGVIGYTPLLTILLPVQVDGLAGRAAGVDWLAWIALAGALAASLGGILFGWLSDITGNRRGWIGAGLVLSSLLLIAVGRMESLAALIGTIVAWQLALNMMLGPLSAWAGDMVPDRAKGLLGGMMAFAPALGALSGIVVTQPGLGTETVRLELVAAMVIACVLPVLLMRPPLPVEADQGMAPAPLPVRQARALRMWLARLCVQVAEATLFAYLFFWLTGLDGSVTDHHTARLFGAIMVLSAPLALLAGRWSDRRDRPIAPLRACAVISALGLLAMALAPGLKAAMLTYGLFGLSSAVFLALHSAQTLRILPRPQRRGRDLGLFNLANTVPSLVMPWLAMALVPIFGFSGLFVLLAALAGAAVCLLAPAAMAARE